MTERDAPLAEQYGPLFSYFCRAVGNVETARDLTQEVFLRAARTTVPRLDDEARAWLFRVARNLALDHQRNERRHPTPIPLVDDATRPASQDVDLAVQQALAALPDLDRDLFLMREVSGLGYSELAEACDLTPDSVRSRLHRTRLRLRELLATQIGEWRTRNGRQRLSTR